MEKELQNKPTTMWVLVLSMFALILTLRLVLMIVADIDFFPINALKIQSSYKFVTREQVQKILLPYLSQSYLMLSENKLSQDLKKNVWVEDVKIKKIWPDRVDVQIIERIPVAFWNNMLVSQKGDLFLTDNDKNSPNLPRLYGPKNQQKDVLHIYEKLSKLLKAQDLFIAKIWLHKNQSWVIALSNGVTIRLGKSNIENRLQRFCEVYPKLFAASFDQISSIDLCYSKGIAVEWRKQADQINSNPKT
jgi:cell division protein FtsQ